MMKEDIVAVVVQPQSRHIGVPVKVGGQSSLTGDSAIYITRMNESPAPSFHPTNLSTNFP